MDKPDKLVVFDGGCGLCHAWVRFVIRHDKHRIFRFTSAQSDTGQNFLMRFDMPLNDFETMLYVEEGVVYKKSAAFLRIVRLLPLPVKLFSCCYIFPGLIRDFIYDCVAQKRYSLFGMRDECSLTEGDLKDRFL